MGRGRGKRKDLDEDWAPVKKQRGTTARKGKGARGGPPSTTTLGDLYLNVLELVADNLLRTTPEEENIYWSKSDIAADAARLMLVGDRDVWRKEQQQQQQLAACAGSGAQERQAPDAAGPSTPSAAQPQQAPLALDGPCYHIGKALMCLLERRYARTSRAEASCTAGTSAAAVGAAGAGTASTGAEAAKGKGQRKKRPSKQEAVAAGRAKLRSEVQEGIAQAKRSRSTKTESMKEWPLNDQDLKALPHDMVKNAYNHNHPIQLFSHHVLKRAALKKFGGLRGLLAKMQKRKNSLQTRQQSHAVRSNQRVEELRAEMQQAGLRVPGPGTSRLCDDFVRNAGKRNHMLEEVLRIRAEVEWLESRTRYERMRQEQLAAEQEQVRRAGHILSGWDFDDDWSGDEGLAYEGPTYEDYDYGIADPASFGCFQQGGGRVPKPMPTGHEADRLRSDDELSSLALDARKDALRAWLRTRPSLEAALTESGLPHSLHALVRSLHQQAQDEQGRATA